jgi:Mg2+/Co2+ transporter CorB
MKHLQLIGLVVCAAFFAGCETTETAGNAAPKGNAEAKRIAAIQERQQEESHMDESQKNLWNAQQDKLNQDGDPIGRETP